MLWLPRASVAVTFTTVHAERERRAVAGPTWIGRIRVQGVGCGWRGQVVDRDTAGAGGLDRLVGRQSEHGGRLVDVDAVDLVCRRVAGQVSDGDGIGLPGPVAGEDIGAAVRSARQAAGVAGRPVDRHVRVVPAIDVGRRAAPSA